MVNAMIGQRDSLSLLLKHAELHVSNPKHKPNLGRLVWQLGDVRRARGRAIEVGVVPRSSFRARVDARAGRRGWRRTVVRVTVVSSPLARRRSVPVIHPVTQRPRRLRSVTRQWSSTGLVLPRHEPGRVQDEVVEQLDVVELVADELRMFRRDVLDDELLRAEELVAFAAAVLAFFLFFDVRLDDVDELVVD